MSKAYSRPVLRIAAPSASVLPPAPAQKSTTISPRLASSSSASSWLPSSCTSTSPRSEDVELVQRRLALHAQAPGRIRRGHGLDAGRRQRRLHLVALGLEGVDAQVQRRRALDALDQRPELVAQLRLQAAAASHSGRLWRSLSGSAMRSTALHLLEPLLLGARSAPRAGSRRCPASRGSPGAAPSRPCPTAPGAGTAARWRSTV